MYPSLNDVNFVPLCSTKMTSEHLLSANMFLSCETRKINRAKIKAFTVMDSVNFDTSECMPKLNIIFYLVKLEQFL